MTDIWNGTGKRIYMQEVGTRDGLQVEEAFVPTDDKIALVNALSEAGMAKIEVTAFVSPKAIPALRDAETVLREIERKPDVVYSALVPNVRGAERAIEARADELNLVMSASESHNLANLRMTREQSFAGAVGGGEARAPTAACRSTSRCRARSAARWRATCPRTTVMEWSRRFLEELGARGVTLCDTTGMAFPSQVARLTEPSASAGTRRQSELTLHFHNTRGMGLANVLAAIDAGADRFDASLGGIGGCPTRRAPPATYAAKRSCTRSSSWATTPASISTGSWKPQAPAGPHRARHPEPDRQGGPPARPASAAGGLRRHSRARAGARP